MISNKSEQKIVNPFDTDDKQGAWKHLLENSRPIPKAEALKKMKEASEMQKKSNHSSRTLFD
jgi:hypothetical protein